MDDRHSAEVAELQRLLAEAQDSFGVPMNPDEDDEFAQADRQMLVNLVRAKEDEIAALRKEMTPRRQSEKHVRTNSSPLRPSRSVEKTHEGLKAIDLDGEPKLEDQLEKMNQEALEHKVRQLIKDNYELKM